MDMRRLFLVLFLSTLLLTLPGIGKTEDVTLKIIFERKEFLAWGDWQEFHTYEKVLKDGTDQEDAATDVGLLRIKTEVTGDELVVKIRATIAGFFNPEIEIWRVSTAQEALLDKEFLGGKLRVKAELGAGGMFAIQNPLNADTFQELVDNLIDFVFIVAVAVAPLMLLIAGFLFLTAGGAPDKITSAKKIIMWTVIGFAVVLLAKGMIAMLQQLLGG